MPPARDVRFAALGVCVDEFRNGCFIPDTAASSNHRAMGRRSPVTPFAPDRQGSGQGTGRIADRSEAKRLLRVTLIMFSSRKKLPTKELSADHSGCAIGEFM